MAAAETGEVLPAPSRDAMNWYIHMLFVQKDYAECRRVIDEQLERSGGMCDYALSVKGMLTRMEGHVQGSLALFQAAVALSPRNIDHLKQVGRCLYLLGKHKAAIDVLEEASRQDSEDWESLHLQGVCYTHLRQYPRAVECFEAANSISRHDATFLQLGKVLSLQGNAKACLSVYSEVLEFSPENPEILVATGLAHLRQGDTHKAFEHLGNALTHDPKNAAAVMAAGSIIQDNRDVDVALVKYRIAAAQTPNSAQLWNNVGMCFFGKGRHVAAAACLKRALYLDPFEWIVAHNLGLVHLAASQHASAFQFFSTAVNIKPDYAPAYTYMGVALAQLGDFENACAAYDRAVHLEKGAGGSNGGGDYLTHLNYAITLANNDASEKAKEQLLRCRELFRAAADSIEPEEDTIAAALALAGQLNVEW